MIQMDGMETKRRIISGLRMALNATMTGSILVGDIERRNQPEEACAILVAIIT